MMVPLSGLFLRLFRLCRRRFLCLPFFRLRLLLLRGEILEDRQFGSVACPIPRPHDPGVSSFASREPCREAGEDLLRVLLVAEEGKRPPSRVRGVLFPERDQAIRQSAYLFRLGNRRLDPFRPTAGVSHVAQQGFPMAGAPPEFPVGYGVSHDSSSRFVVFVSLLPGRARTSPV